MTTKPQRRRRERAAAGIPEKPRQRNRPSDERKAERAPREAAVVRINAGQKLGAALALLDAIEATGHGADRAAADWFRRNRVFDGAPRGDIMDLVEGVLRHRAALDWWIKREGLGAPINNRTRIFVAHVLVHGREAASVAKMCDGARQTPDPLDMPEQKLLASLKGHTLDHPAMPLLVRAECPAWLLPHLEARFGKTLESEMTALLRIAPVDLRANTLKADRAAAQSALSASGWRATLAPLSPLGLKLGPRTDIGKLQPLADGLVEVQDEGSQLAALLVDARPGQYVIDYCAGAGGKTLVLAAAMQNRGHLVALDVNEVRLTRARQRLRRAGTENAECRVLDAKWVKRQAGRADRVLVDAPCTGTGTWRRKPDARWRLQPNDLAELLVRQAEILDSAQRLVAPGGRLIYVTCSLLPAENEEQITAFIGRHPAFSPVPVEGVWREVIGGGCPASGEFLHLTPARHGTDGFFVAILERRASPA